MADGGAAPLRGVVASSVFGGWWCCAFARGAAARPAVAGGRWWSARRRARSGSLVGRVRAVGGAAQFCAWRRRLVGAVTASRSRGAAIASVRRVAVLRSRGIVGSSFRRAAVRRVRAVPSPVDGGGGCRSRRDRSSCTAAGDAGHCRRRRLNIFASRTFGCASRAGRVLLCARG
jgi:hypothetical protein